jgi:signal transduction histidine kinase
LRTGFDRINGLCYARDGTLWLATHSNVCRYVRGAWLQSETADGLPSAPITAIREERDGEIIASSSAGEFAFQPDVDRDPPKTTIFPSPELGATIHEGALVKLTFGGRDKWSITRPAQLLYSYRLDEREWSQFQQMSTTSFSDLSVGKHVFQVRAMDRNANIDPQPARLEFAVALPWYRETRLVWILCVALAVALFLAALAFNRHRRLQHSYADVERQVAERTRELELANRELLHSQKMNALGTLAAGIAHDFNNILSIVKGSTQLIEENLDRPEKIRTRLDRIKLVVQQGAGIVEAMLGFSRTSEQGTAACNVNTVVEDTIKLLGDRFVREIDVRFDRAEGLPEILAPRDFVQQVLLNFIFNAQDAMERKPMVGKQILLQTRLVNGHVARAS